MRSLKQFIDEGMSRLGLRSYNKLSQALGYKSSGFLTLIRNAGRALPEESEAQWITVLRIPPEQQAEFHEAAASSRANQKADVREDYRELEAKLAELRAILLEVVDALERGKKPSREVLARLKRALGSR